MIRGEGDVISGWDINAIRVVPKKESLQEELDFFIGTYGQLSAAADPAPITGIPGRQGYIGKAERVGFDIFISINRLSEYYVLGIIVPTLLLVALSFITVRVEFSALDDFSMTCADPSSFFPLSTSFQVLLIVPCLLLAHFPFDLSFC